MRLPRHDTPLSLPAEPPREAIAADEALLEQLPADGSCLERWWLARSAAVVVGIGLRSRLSLVLDLERCRAERVEVLERRAGGGAVLLETEGVLCGALAVPTASLPADITDSYRWLGDRLVAALDHLGLQTRRAAVGEARADIASLRSSHDNVARLLLNACYGALSPHEIVVGEGGAKLVGLAQVRRRHASLFQFGILLRDQSRLADYLRVTDDVERERLRHALAQRSVGISALTSRSASEVAGAVAGATPCAR